MVKEVKSYLTKRIDSFTMVSNEHLNPTRKSKIQGVIRQAIGAGWGLATERDGTFHQVSTNQEKAKDTNMMSAENGNEAGRRNMKSATFAM